MTRKELANEVFWLMKATTILNANEIWRAIAETDDWSLTEEYYKLKERVESKLKERTKNAESTM